MRRSPGPSISSKETPTACTEPPQDLVDTIEESLNEPGATLAGAVMVDVGPRDDERLSPDAFLAAYIVIGDQLDSGVPALWAIGPTGRGSIFAVDSPAREFSDWGAATRFPSAMAEARSKMLEYPEAREALDCLKRAEPR